LGAGSASIEGHRVDEIRRGSEKRRWLRDRENAGLIVVCDSRTDYFEKDRAVFAEGTAEYDALTKFLAAA